MGSQVALTLTIALGLAACSGPKIDLDRRLKKLPGIDQPSAITFKQDGGILVAQSGHSILEFSPNDAHLLRTYNVGVSGQIGGQVTSLASFGDLVAAGNDAGVLLSPWPTRR